jgi:Protein of unknown function (DUF3309)
LPVMMSWFMNVASFRFRFVERDREGARRVPSRARDRATVSRQSYSVNLSGSRRGCAHSAVVATHRSAWQLALRLQVLPRCTYREDRRMLSTVLIVVLVLALIGALPAWPYSSGWGFYPSGGLGIVVLVVLVLLLTGRV